MAPRPVSHDPWAESCDLGGDGFQHLWFSPPGGSSNASSVIAPRLGLVVIPPTDGPTHPHGYFVVEPAEDFDQRIRDDTFDEMLRRFPDPYEP